MAKASTTHVIEIETGIGEPAFIPLTLGQELQPISVGKKGMWRIESARVLDVHAFVYFDGTALFLQSADESASASVDGYRVGKAWTELHAPCKIEIGAARLRYRSLSAPVEPERPQQHGNSSFPNPPPPPIINTEQVPVRALKQSGAVPAHQDGVGPTQLSAQQQQQNGLSASGQRRAMGSGSHGAPQQHQPQQGEENPTRMEGTGGRGRRETGPPSQEQLHQMQQMQHMQNMQNMQMMQMPMQQDGTLGITPVQPIPQGVPAHRAMPTGPVHPGMVAMALSQPGMHPGMQPGMNVTGPVHPGMMPPPSGPMMPPGSGPYPQQGPYNNSMGPYGSMTGGQFGQMGGPGMPPQPGTPQYYVAKYKELSPPKRILVVLAPFCVISSIYLLFFDNKPKDPNMNPGTMSFVDAGSMVATTQPVVQPPPPTQPTTQPQPTQQPGVTVQCPPGFVPYPIAVAPGQAIPCVPAGTPLPIAATATPAPTQPPPPPATTTAPPPPQPPVASNKTLERQAVDFVAVNDYARAAQVYEQLQAQNPQNRVYAEAARILRAKADAGAP